DRGVDELDPRVLLPEIGDQRVEALFLTRTGPPGKHLDLAPALPAGTGVTGALRACRQRGHRCRDGEREEAPHAPSHANLPHCLIMSPYGHAPRLIAGGRPSSPSGSCRSVTTATQTAPLPGRWVLSTLVPIGTVGLKDVA